MTNDNKVNKVLPPGWRLVRVPAHSEIAFPGDIPLERVRQILVEMGFTRGAEAEEVSASPQA